MIRWSTPTLDYNPAKWETDKITLYLNTGTPHDFNKQWDRASKYLMGEDTTIWKSLFQMTIQQNLDCLIRLRPNIRAFNIDNIPQDQETDLLHSPEYALLWWQMTLANLTPKPLGLHTTPETTYINEAFCLKTISLPQINEDLVYKRFSSKLVEIIERHTRHTHMQHNTHTPFWLWNPLEINTWRHRKRLLHSNMRIQ